MIWSLALGNTCLWLKNCCIVQFSLSVDVHCLSNSQALSSGLCIFTLLIYYSKYRVSFSYWNQASLQTSPQNYTFHQIFFNLHWYGSCSIDYFTTSNYSCIVNSRTDALCASCSGENALSWLTLKVIIFSVHYRAVEMWVAKISRSSNTVNVFFRGHEELCHYMFRAVGGALSNCSE